MKDKVKYYLSNGWIWVLIVVIAFGVWGLAFYWMSRPSADLTVQFWIGSDDWLTKEDRLAIEDIAGDYGMEECTFGVYNPTDGMYAQAFGVKGTSIDVFVLSREEALAVAEFGLFATLDGYDEVLDYDGTAIGIEVGDDMYMLLNSDSYETRKTLLDGILAYFAEK